MSGEVTSNNHGACPGCGEQLGSDVVLCVRCGYHLKLNRFLATATGLQSRPGDPTNPYQSPAAESSVGHVSSSSFLDILFYLLWIEGRAPRLHWWISRFAYLLFGIVIDVVNADRRLLSPGLQIAMMLPFIWVLIAMDVKRWHDLDKSGLWCLIYLIPCAGPLWVLWELGCERGDACRNYYGEDPLQSRNKLLAG